jgi:hypothetical protein
MNYREYAKWVGLAVIGALLLWVFFFMPQDAKAADLGGSCCADLEERIAELESTTARKGNTKVKVVITGQINKAVAAYDIGDEQDARVIENSASESFVAVRFEADIRSGWKAGGAIELGQGKTGLEADLLSGLDLKTNNDIYTRQSYVFLTTPLGRVSVGLQSMATDDLTALSVANTDAATKRLTLDPIHYVFVTAGPISILELEVEPFNGEKADSVKYDTAGLLGPFNVSAAWGAGDDSWDVALRYAGEFQGFVMNAGVGYEVDKELDLGGFGIGIETKTASVNAGLLHVGTGLFVQGSAARLDIDGFDEIDAYHVQAGLQRRLFEGVGPTTIWADYSDWSEGDLKFYGLGFNQNVAGSIDLYLTARRYELGDEEADVGMAGARVKF